MSLAVNLPTRYYSVILFKKILNIQYLDCIDIHMFILFFLFTVELLDKEWKNIRNRFARKLQSQKGKSGDGAK